MSDTPADVIGFYSSQLGVDDAIAESVLASALARGGSFAELYFEHKRSGSLSFEDQQVKSTQASLSQGVGIRVVEGDAIGYAYTEDLSLDAMRRAAETAAQIAHGSQDADPVDVTAESYAADRYAIASPSTSTPLAEKVELLRRADQAARAWHSSIARVDASMVDEEKRVLIVRSDGRMVADYQPLLRFNVSCLSELEGERRNARWGGGGRMGMAYFDDHSPESLAEEAARQAVLQQEAREAPAGTFPVVLAAGDSGILLHEAVGHGLEADFNRKEHVQLLQPHRPAGRLGTGHRDRRRHARPSRVARSTSTTRAKLAGRNLLIENGLLAAYMQDRISSDHFGVAPSGNGRRQSFRHAPMPRMTNTYMTAGQDDPEDLIRRVDYGIYCKAFSGGQVNITNGDFVFSVTEGYLIENGQITAPIRDVNLIGNGPDVLSKVTGVGHDLEMSDGRWTCGKSGQSVPVGVGIPTVLVSGITVGGTQMRSGAGMSA